ncbi:MAG: hypothetical protein GF329_07425 [Candidatus Lokiarchaeota archaeon]|nr:hypothetical protein [Candidatus Lokiarchaeota archaeon]
MSNIDKIKDYLKENNLQLDDKYLKFLEYIGGDDDALKLKDSDEYSHLFPEYLPNWSESWYFNFIDEQAGVDWVSRISYNPFDMKSNVLSVLFIDNNPQVYVNRLKIDEMPEDRWDLDKKVTYELVKPHSEWNLKFEDRKFELDLNWKARFESFSYLEGIDILEYLEDYIDLIGKASQQHYEQGGIVKGTLKLKKKNQERKINCLGHRDHSWGIREWQAVDKWNWISAQFEDKTINIAKVIIGDNILVSGFISTKDANIRIKDVEIKTEIIEYEDKFGSKNKRPEKSRFEITDIDDKKYIIKSRRRTSIDLPVPIPSKIKTVISEQVHNFSLNGSDYEGTGISEYLYKY